MALGRQWHGRASRTATLLVATGVLVAISAAEAKPPTTAPVTLTIQAKSEPQVYCPECMRFSGRIASPKAACRAHRLLANAVRYRAGSENAGKTYHDAHFVETDGQGRWDIVVDPGPNPLAWMQVSVPKERIGNVVCQAARAKVTL